MQDYQCYGGRVQDLTDEDSPDFDDHVHSGDTHQISGRSQSRRTHWSKSSQKMCNARDENSESKYEYSDGRQVDQREEPEQVEQWRSAHNRRVRRTWQQERWKFGVKVWVQWWQTSRPEGGARTGEQWKSVQDWGVSRRWQWRMGDKARQQYTSTVSNYPQTHPHSRRGRQAVLAKCRKNADEVH